MFHVGVFCFATHCELKWGSILYLHFSDKHFPSDKLKQYLDFRNEFHSGGKRLALSDSTSDLAAAVLSCKS